MQPLSSLLSEFLSRTGMEELVNSYWKTRAHRPGQLSDIMDGNIWRTAKGPDGSLFFNAEDDTDELRIAVTMGLDW